MAHRSGPVPRLPITVRRCENREEYQRQWRKLNPNWWLKRYGITLEQYEKMLREQNNSCAICQTEAAGGRHNKFHVDHCHSTNKVRGLLCDKCNRGLGFFNDNAFRMSKAASYLQKYIRETI